MSNLQRGVKLLYLSRADVEALHCCVSDVLHAVEEAFREKAAGKVEMPPKPGIHTRANSFIHAMPAFLRGSDVAGVKWVSGYPENSRFGLPYITGLFILNCAETGVPISVMDCTWMTEKRTAAATALAVRRLAVNAQKLAIIGAGIQGRANTEALRAVLPSLSCVSVYDPKAEAVEQFREIFQTNGFDVEQALSVKDATSDADVIVTCAPIVQHPNPLIESSWMKPGSVGVSLDFDAMFRAETAHAADRMWVDDSDQFEYYRQHAGHFVGMPTSYCELMDLVAETAGRKNSAERHIVINLGLALEDVGTANMLYRRALDLGVGTVLPS